MQWKKKREKETVFPVRGAFWENRGSAYRSQPSKGFKGAFTSLLLKSFHASERVTSSHTQKRLTCLSSCGLGCAYVHGKCSVGQPSSPTAS